MTSSTVRAKRTTLLDKVNRQGQAINQLATLATDELAEHGSTIRRLEAQRKADHPVLHECVAKILALEAKVETLQGQLDADRSTPWWRRPWW